MIITNFQKDKATSFWKCTVQEDNKKIEYDAYITKKAHDDLIQNGDKSTISLYQFFTSDKKLISVLYHISEEKLLTILANMTESDKIIKLE